MFLYLSLYYVGEHHRDKNPRILLEGKNAKASKYKEDQHSAFILCHYFSF